jgi:glycosyltransferase involved in cell wall biosynthesis
VTPLRFCFVTTFYPPYNFGGDGIGIRRLAHGLARRGHEVTVVHDVDAYKALAPGPDPAAITEPEGIEVVSLRSRLGALSCLLTQQSGRPLANGRRIRELLATGKFDVVNFHNISLVGGPGILSYGKNSLRLYMAHEHWLVCPMHVLWRHKRERCTGRECLRCTLKYRRPPQLYRYSGMMERHLREVDAYIAMSKFSRDKHHEFGFPHPMELLPYFLPDPEGESAPEPGLMPHTRPYFLFVGRLEKIKGLDDVIPLFRDYPEADLLIAGDGEYTEELKRIGADVDRVKFLGRLPMDELKRYYANTLALIVPSVCFETFGIILIEAFSQGVPVIARRLGPFPEIVEHAGGGELFETTEELLAAMTRIQSDPVYRERLAHRGHQSFRETWTEGAVVPQYLDIVRRTADRCGKTRISEMLKALEAN